MQRNYLENKDSNLINLYCNGKELTEGEEEIGNICKNNDTLDLVMVSISINDSIINSENKMKEKIISKLIPECKYHKDNKDYFFV